MMPWLLACALVGVAFDAPATARPGGIRSQFIVLTSEPTVYPLEPRALRFDMELNLLGITSLLSGGQAPIAASERVAVDGSGRYWICWEPATNTKLMRIAPDGAVLQPASLLHNPVSIQATASGDVYALTRIGLFSFGPLYRVNADGGVTWASFKGPAVANLTWGYSPHLAVTSDGHPWILGIDGGPCDCDGWGPPKFVEVNPTNGSVLSTFLLPAYGLSVPGPTLSWHVTPGLDSTFWTVLGTVEDSLVHHDGSTILSKVPFDGGHGGGTVQNILDGRGNAITVGKNTAAGGFGKEILHVKADTGEVLGEYSFPRPVEGFTVGPTGEEVFVSVNEDNTLPRLYRLNLATGVKSSVLLAPMAKWIVIPEGDASGFFYANIVDRNGDNDGDGVPNGVETAAASNPFDPESRPNGPKAFLSFVAGSNSIVLRFVDPDGLQHPTLGLDLATLSLTAGRYGEILPALWPFATSAAVSADGTDATITFGALSLPDDLRIRLEVQVRDRTHWIGSDWQVTPPGDLY